MEQGPARAVFDLLPKHLHSVSHVAKFDDAIDYELCASGITHLIIGKRQAV